MEGGTGGNVEPQKNRVLRERRALGASKGTWRGVPARWDARVIQGSLHEFPQL